MMQCIGSHAWMIIVCAVTGTFRMGVSRDRGFDRSRRLGIDFECRPVPREDFSFSL